MHVSHSFCAWKKSSILVVIREFTRCLLLLVRLQAFVPEVEQVMQAALKVVCEAKVSEDEDNSQRCFCVSCGAAPG